MKHSNIFNNLLPVKKAFFYCMAMAFAVFFAACTKTDSLKQVNSAVSSGTIGASRLAGKPNIVFFIGDDVGYEIPTVNGGQSYNTPNIDALAAAGIRFTQTYGAADCSPSRFMILTGKYSYRNYTEWGVMKPSERTIGNMFKDAGYATCYAGKWQLDGSAASVSTFGWDKYSIWLDYKTEPEASYGFKYKSPRIFQDGVYLTNTLNKYSPDIYMDYMLQFINDNKEKPFVVYYSCPLPHKPFGPTPADPDFASWDGASSDDRKFPGLISYMDSQIPMLTNKLQSLGLDQNTVFIYVGDNGTPKGITSRFNGYDVVADKGRTTTYGTHVPLMIKWPGHIAPGTVTNQLVDFTDFLPTLANIIDVPVPTTYGELDGKSFYPVLTGSPSSERKEVFLAFNPFISSNNRPFIRMALNGIYKLYDDGRFYNTVYDVLETNPLPDSVLTKQVRLTKRSFQKVLDEEK